MHELGLTKELVDLVVEKGRELGAKRIVSVRVTAGALSEFQPDSLRLYFTTLGRGTLAEGAELVVETVPALARCRSCDSEFAPDDLHAACPDCGSEHVEMLAGHELCVQSIDVEQ